MFDPVLLFQAVQTYSKCSLDLKIKRAFNLEFSKPPNGVLVSENSSNCFGPTVL